MRRRKGPNSSNSLLVHIVQERFLEFDFDPLDIYDIPSA